MSNDYSKSEKPEYVEHRADEEVAQGITRCREKTCRTFEEDCDNDEDNEAQEYGFENRILCWNPVEETKQETADAESDHQATNQRREQHW